jgi:hypothetical protein
MRLDVPAVGAQGVGELALGDLGRLAAPGFWRLGSGRWIHHQQLLASVAEVLGFWRLGSGRWIHGGGGGAELGRHRRLRDGRRGVRELAEERGRQAGLVLAAAADDELADEVAELADIGPASGAA